MKRRVVVKAIFLGVLALAGASCFKKVSPPLEPVGPSIPPRAQNALTGSQFAQAIASMTEHERQQAALNELKRGNVPDFLRHFKPVTFSSNGRTLTLFVTPDYLAIGSDSDFLRMPLSFPVAIAITEQFGCQLPTAKIVDLVYEQAEVKLEPRPLPASDQMRSIEYFMRHQAIVQSQLPPNAQGRLIAGHKKDLVLSNRLISRPGKIAIYGWHRGDGTPIQPLSTLHGENYADYSHGVRLISNQVLVDGRLVALSDVLADPILSELLSYERPAWQAALTYSARKINQF